MISALVGASLRHRWVVVALALLTVVYGLYVSSRARLDVFPDFVPPQVVVQTESPGLSAEQVELLITRPLEHALGGLRNLESLRSQSVQGLSIITVTFGEGTDLIVARQLLAEQLAEAVAELPAGVKTPKLSPLTSATMDLLVMGFVSDRLTPMELRTLVDTTVRPRVLSVPGVASTIEFGGEIRQLQVQVKPERLVAFDLSIQDVLEAARHATAIVGAGYVETSAQRVVVRSEGGSIGARELGEVVLTHHAGSNVRLKDVADVIEGPEPKFGDSLVQGRPGVILKTLSQFGANTLETTRRLEAALTEMTPALEAQGVTVYPALFRPATFIETAVANIRTSLLLGGALVAIVLVLFLLNLRTAAISLTAIPLPLLAAVIVLDRFGATLNTITLGGLVIAIGEVVDDAIIAVENIYRRLRENDTRAEPRPALRVVFDASLEVRSAVVYATIIVCLVFVPVLTMSGLQGRLFAPLAIAYILAVMASLVVALTVTPALALLMLARPGQRHPEPRPVQAARRLYGTLLAPLMGRPGWVIGAIAFLCAISAGMARGFGGEFLPELREGAAVVHVDFVPGTSLQETLRTGVRISQALLKNPLVESVPEQAGRAEQGEDPWGPHRSEWHINLNVHSGDEEEQAHQEMRETLEKFPGITFEITTFLGDRIGETISGETASVVISIFGDDLDQLDDAAQDVARVTAGVRGAVDVNVAAPPGLPQLVVQLRPERLERFGYQADEVLEALQVACQGIVTGETTRGVLTSDVVVLLDERSRSDPERIGDLVVRNSAGTRVPLRALADCDLTMGRYMLLHEGGRRRQTVTCNVEGRDVASFVEELRSDIDREVQFPRGVYAEYGGEAEARAGARRELLLHSSFAGFGVLLVLALVVGTWRNLLLVLANLPFALVGGALAVALSGGVVSVGSLVGLVTLFGITTRNSIMMMSHYEHLVNEEGMTWGLAAALRGASERLLPITMTALVTGLGLLPIALGAGDAGREIEGQMAIVILGGLITSTALNLFVLPTLALRFASFRVL